MYRASFITSLFALLTLLAVSCAPGPHTSCPAGQVIPEGGNTCVENTCINYNCDANQHCVVGEREPYCVCDAGFESDIDTSGATTPVLVCKRPQQNSCSCTGYNTHCDSMGDCVCNPGYLPIHDYSGIHPVLDCQKNPCTEYSCSQYELCEPEFDENQNRWIDVCK